MSTRKTTAERIAEQKAKKEQLDNEIKRLENQQKEEERKKRNHRICKRGAHLESLLPDTIGLSDARFFSFLEKTVANDFGRRALAAFVAEQEKEDVANAVAEPENDDNTSAANTAVTSAQGSNMTPLKSAAPKLNDGKSVMPKPAPTAMTSAGDNVSRPGNAAKQAG